MCPAQRKERTVKRVKLSAEQRMALTAFARQQGRQWRRVLDQMWNPPKSNYWGLDTNAAVMEQLRELTGRDVYKLPVVS